MLAAQVFLIKKEAKNQENNEASARSGQLLARRSFRASACSKVIDSSE